MAIGGTVFGQRAVRNRVRPRSLKVATSHTYELRRVLDGWLLIVDEQAQMRCRTLPEANLALIGARAAHAAEG